MAQCQKIMCKYDLHDSNIKRWLVANHPDKSGHPERIANLTLSEFRDVLACYKDKSYCKTSKKKEKKENEINDDMLKRGANLEGANLSYRKLDGIDLQEANLTSANLEQISLNNAKLIDVNFSDANLYLATLKNADLTNANFFETNLSAADFTGANLTGTKFESTIIGWTDFTNANLSGASFYKINHSRPRGGTIVRAIFRNTNLTGATFDKFSYLSLLGNAKNILTGLTINGSGSGEEYDVHLSSMNLYNLTLSNVMLINSRLESVDFNGSTMHKIQFKNC